MLYNNTNCIKQISGSEDSFYYNDIVETNNLMSYIHNTNQI